MRKRILAIIAIVGILLVMTIPMATPVLAQGNTVNMNLFKDKSIAHNGDTVRYTVDIYNGAGGDPAKDIFVHFHPPGAGGLPDDSSGAQIDLGTITKLPVGYNVIFDTNDTGDDDLSELVPSKITRHKYVSGLAVVLDLNPGVPTAQAQALYAGKLDVPGNDNATGDKEVTLNMIYPNTLVTIEAIPSPVNLGSTTNLTITETNTGTCNLTNPYVILTNNRTAATYNLTSITPFIDPPDFTTTFGGDPNDDNILFPNETWNWTIHGVPVTTPSTTFTAVGHGIDPLGLDITPDNSRYPYLDFSGEKAETTVTINEPHTTVHISAEPASLLVGGGYVLLTVTEKNDGSIDLKNVHVDVMQGANTWNLSTSGSSPLGWIFTPESTTPDILSKNETWTWTKYELVTATTKFTATGYGEYGDPLDPTIVTYPPMGSEYDEVTIPVEPPPPPVPASSSLGIGLLILAFTGVMALFVYRRTHKSHQS